MDILYVLELLKVSFYATACCKFYATCSLNSIPKQKILPEGSI